MQGFRGCSCEVVERGLGKCLIRSYELIDGILINGWMSENLRWIVDIIRS